MGRFNGNRPPRGQWLEVARGIAQRLHAPDAICDLATHPVFRGYFQRQLLAFTGSLGWTSVGQSVLFGLAHAYRGGLGIVVATSLGLSFTWLAQRRQSLRPSMITHALWDIAGSILCYIR